MELPVKLKVHDSVFVPLAKWSMLLAGNYRCVQNGEIRSIRDAVHSDLEQSREVYNWVSELCRTMGAAEADQVPFEKYAAAASGLAKPSSAARALAGGAPNIERVDSLVQRIAAEHGMHLAAVDETVAAVEKRLTRKPPGALDSEASAVTCRREDRILPPARLPSCSACAAERRADARHRQAARR